MATTVTRRTIDLAGLDVPLVEATGSEDGPLLTVISGVHGCEYASMDGVRRLTRSLIAKPPSTSLEIGRSAAKSPCHFRNSS